MFWFVGEVNVMKQVLYFLILFLRPLLSTRASLEKWKFHGDVLKVSQLEQSNGRYSNHEKAIGLFQQAHDIATVK